VILLSSLNLLEDDTSFLIVYYICASLQFAAAPFQAAMLFLPPPWCFVSHVVGILIGEMWLGVCAAIVIELSPSHLTASCVGLYFFIIQIIGGNLILLVTPLADALSLRLAIGITFPGFYIVAGLGFTVTLILFTSLRKPEVTDDDYKVASGSDGEQLEALQGDVAEVQFDDLQEKPSHVTV